MNYSSLIFIITISSVRYVNSNPQYEVEIEVSPKPNCTCVPYYQCSEDSGNLISDGVGLLDLRKLDNSPCKGYWDVCCNVTKDSFATTTEAVERPQGCGYHNPAVFPWSAALLFQELDQFAPSYKCGISIINRKALLTAAHCLEDEGIYSVRVGNLIRKVAKSVKHPRFNGATLQNDLALIFLDEPVEASDYAGFICIAPIGFSLDHTRCTATAWVKNEENGSHMTMIKLPVVPRDKCLNLLRTTRLGQFFHLHKSFLCAGGRANEDTCGGDGGSPLICPVQGQPGRYHQVGIVSWGIGCGKSDIPGVYVNLPIFRAWIDEEMIKNGLDITSYRY